ncbi:MAG: hypothetical protein H6619_06985 [Deltaproteobacteria bacterium]|nr:hypothetical protein [Deltaproteobacteria bacterium]
MKNKQRNIMLFFLAALFNLSSSVALALSAAPSGGSFPEDDSEADLDYTVMAVMTKSGPDCSDPGIKVVTFSGDGDFEKENGPSRNPRDGSYTSSGGYDGEVEEGFDTDGEYTATNNGAGYSVVTTFEAGGSASIAVDENGVATGSFKANGLSLAFSGSMSGGGTTTGGTLTGVGSYTDERHCEVSLYVVVQLVIKP